MGYIEQKSTRDGGLQFRYRSDTGEVLGSAFLSLVNETWKLDTIQVNANCRRQGIGRQLLETIIAEVPSGSGLFQPDYRDMGVANFYRALGITVDKDGNLNW